MPKKKEEVVDEVVEETTEEVAKEPKKASKPKKAEKFEPFVAKVQSQKVNVVNLIEQKDGNTRLHSDDGCQYVVKVVER